MPSVRVSGGLKDQIYFVTLTIRNLNHIFNRHKRFQILEDTFVYCQENKNLKIHAFVFMLNHLHFIASAKDMGGILRDMKSHISRELKRNIMETEPNILKLFKSEKGYEFWEKTNYPKLIFTENFFTQKVNYIHMNPVKKQYVHFPEDWWWSSASKIPSKIKISELEL